VDLFSGESLDFHVHGLGWLVSAFLLAGQSPYMHAFIGPTLCATSVGITARVLQDMNQLRTRDQDHFGRRRD
jgi:Kef-type K+ transport system membrane component KefB